MFLADGDQAAGAPGVGHGDGGVDARGQDVEQVLRLVGGIVRHVVCTADDNKSTALRWGYSQK